MPYATFFVIHFEVGGHTESLEHQMLFWPAGTSLVTLANRYAIKLTLQFNPQWAEYIVIDKGKLDLIKRWQQQGHEISLHHHGYDHGDWNGYSNRAEIRDDPRFRGNIQDMMKLMRQLVHPFQVLSGTVTDEECDYPQDIRYDTEGIKLAHARSKPKWVTLGSKDVIQAGMAFLSLEEDLEYFSLEYLKSGTNEVFGVVTHEKDFAKNPVIIEEWFKFIRSRGESVKTVSQIIMDYEKVYPIKFNEKPLNFLSDVVGVVRETQENDL